MKQYFLALLLSTFLFTTESIGASCLTLSWTAPGDDGHSGRAARYELRYSPVPIDMENWTSATLARNLPRPAVAGEREYFTVSELDSDRLYYFAIRTADECDNWSGLSNVVARRSPVDECEFVVGNANCDADDEVTISDISTIIDFLFMGGILCCPLEANANGDPNGDITISDISTLVDHLFVTGIPLPSCP